MEYIFFYNDLSDVILTAYNHAIILLQLRIYNDYCLDDYSTGDLNTTASEW